MTRDRPPRDQAWFEGLFRSHHRTVLAFARRRVPEAADDVVAQVFAVAWRRREELPDEPLPWLYRAAGNEILHARRGEARRTRLATAAQAGVEPPVPDPSDGVAAALDGQALIRGSLERLPEADQEVLRLWAWEQLDVARIAFVLGCNVGAARVRLHRARRRLRAVVLAAEAVTEPSPAAPARPRIVASALTEARD